MDSALLPARSCELRRPELASTTDQSCVEDGAAGGLAWGGGGCFTQAWMLQKVKIKHGFSLDSAQQPLFQNCQRPPFHPAPSPPPCPLASPHQQGKHSRSGPFQAIPSSPFPSPFLLLSFQCFRTFRMDWPGLLLKLKLQLSTKSGRAGDLEAGSSLLHWWAPCDVLGRLHPGGLDSVFHLSPGSP